MGSSIQAEIAARVGEGPATRCLAFYRPGEPVCWLSREEVHRAAAGAAGQLQRYGVEPGDVCIIALRSGQTAATMVVATLLLGAVPLLIAPPALHGAQADVYDTLYHVLRRVRARLVIWPRSLESDLIRLERGAPTTRFVFAPFAPPPDDAAQVVLPVLPSATDVAAMQLTSGTTTTPRICVWDHHAVLAAIDGMARAMALMPGDVCFNWTPLYHDMGLVNNFLLCLMRGVPLVLLSPQEFIRRPVVWLQGLSETRATLTWSPNFGFTVTARKAADSDLAGVRLDHVRAFWNAAERIHLDTLDLFHRRFADLGVRREALKTNYGCAENIGGATFSGLDEPARYEYIDREALHKKGSARIAAAPVQAPAVPIVSVGRAHPGLKIQIRSLRDRPVPDGRVGQICLESPSCMLRYQGDTRGTAHAIRNTLLYTGDLGYLRDGELFWVGRLRERITIHGKKIDPSAFEAVLTATPGLREGCFAAFGVPDEFRGTERVVVVSEVRLPMVSSPEQLFQTIRRECFRRLGLSPDDIVLVEPGTLQKTSSGKRRHRHFRELYLDGGFDSVRLAPRIPLRRTRGSETSVGTGRARVSLS